MLLGRADQLGLDVSRVVRGCVSATQVGEEAEQAVLLGHQPDMRSRAPAAGRCKKLVQRGDLVSEMS